MIFLKLMHEITIQLLFQKSKQQQEGRKNKKALAENRIFFTMETHSESSDPLIESASRISKRFPRCNTFRVIGPRRSLNHFLSFTSIGEQYECFRPICFEDCDGKQHFIEFWFKLSVMQGRLLGFKSKMNSGLLIC